MKMGWDLVGQAVRAEIEKKVKKVTSGSDRNDVVLALPEGLIACDSNDCRSQCLCV